jgi:mannose-6-phosphate isomerase
MLTCLKEHRVSKPWGRTDVPRVFGSTSDGEPLGEVWFQREGGDDALLVKYPFTSERLSIQVHPDDVVARNAGLSSGKDEAWLILDAEPEAEIAIGMRNPVSADELRAAALNGSVVDLVNWRRVSRGDAYYSPAGTVHAIGAGLTLLEVQQNCDVTYRLYDYGRPRELHLNEGIRAAKTDLDVGKSIEIAIDESRSVLIEGPKFIVERWRAGRASLLADKSTPLWLIPLSGPASANGQELAQPSVWIAECSVALEVGTGGDLLVAYEGQSIRAPA